MNAFDSPLTDLISKIGWPISYFLLYKVLLFCMMQYVLFLAIATINALVPNEVEEIKINADRRSAAISNLTLMDFITAKEQQNDQIELTSLRREVAELRNRVKKSAGVALEGNL